MKWVKRLESKWGVTAFQVFIILLVFALTGSTIVLIKKPILSWIDPAPGHKWIVDTLYFILIFPIYNVVLLVYGWVFGQFRFFWEKEKKMWDRIKKAFT